MATSSRRKPAGKGKQVTGRRKVSRLAAGKDRGLSVLEVRFAEEYLVDLNATQAAIRAGYSAKGASVAGVRLLSRDKVARRISELNAGRSKRTRINADRVIEELGRIAFSNITHVCNFAPGAMLIKPTEALPEDVQVAISEMSETVTEAGGSRRIKMHDKIAALDRLGRHFNLFKSEEVAQTPVNIIIDLVPVAAADGTPIRPTATVAPSPVVSQVNVSRRTEPPKR